MDRIERIKYLESEADQPDKEASRLRWEAAQLIHAEVSGGTSRRELGERIGKSHTHVNYMFKCWDLVGNRLVSAGTELSALPPFQAIYMSTEVRGETAATTSGSGGSASGREAGGGRSSASGREARADGTTKQDARSWIEVANEALTNLGAHPAFWPLLTETERTTLASFVPVIRKIARSTSSA